MAHDSFDYPRMIARALRGVARQALMETAENGLPGEHHFYLTFRTRGEGVQVPGFLRDQYPEEMTIVLQNQFWDLAVDEEMFSVSLTFNGARRRIVVPFESLTAFADPSAQLGLRFEPPPAGEAEESEEEGAGSPFGEGGGAPFAATAGGGGAGMGASPSAVDAEVDGEGDEAGGAPGGGPGGEVVHLDRFRRRSQDGETPGPEAAGSTDDDVEDGAEEQDGGEPDRET